MNLDADVLVIGSGMAGLVAGTVSASAGLKTIVVTRGQGATADSSGALDILGYLPEAGSAVGSPLEGLYAISALHPLHPYSLLGFEAEEGSVNGDRVVEQVRAATEWFLEQMRASSIPYIGTLDELLWPLTMLGTTKPTALLQKTMDPRSLDEESDSTVLFAGVRGFPDFHSSLAAKAFLEARQSEGTGPRRVSNCTIDLVPFGVSHNLSAIEIARHLDRPEGVDALVQQLRSSIEMSGATHVVIPPILGLREPVARKDFLEEQLGATIIELLGFPPSVPGVRLQLALEDILRMSGGTLLRGHEVASARISDGRVLRVTANAPARSIEIEASAFVLTTGKFIGGGISGITDGLHETVFGLPVFDSHRESTEGLRPQRLTDLVSITSSGHRLFGCGVGCDETLRPITSDGDRYASNLFCAGAVMAGHNWPQEKSGLGVALSTGYVAGQAAIGKVRS